MTLDRRQFLCAGALPPLAALLRPRWSPFRAAAEPRLLIVVELVGGNDGLNTLVPLEDDAYRRARPTLALPAAKCLRVGPLDGLHPAMLRTRERFERGQVALVQGVGSPVPNLSHFHSQDVWATASTAPVARDAGWLARLHDEALAAGAWSPSPLALIAVGRDTPPHAFESRVFVAPAVATFRSFRCEVDAAGARATDLHGPRLDDLESAQAAARAAGEELARADRTPTRGTYPATSIGDHLRMAAQIAIARLETRVIWVTTPSYDTHTRQAREHGILLGRLDAALGALLDDLESAGLLETTLVMTVSEFGRRVRESGVGNEAGTDHGSASVALLAGGAVRGGLHGERPSLTELDQDGNLRPNLDFRALYASVIEDGFGLDTGRVLAEPVPRLALVRRSA